MAREHKPWYRKSADAWYTTIDGGQVRLAKGEDNKAEAMREFHRLMSTREKQASHRRVVKLGGLADMHIDSIERNREPDAAKIAIGRIVDFVAFVGREMPVSEIKPYHLTGWLDSKEWAANSRNTCSGIVKHMFAWAAEQGYIPENMMAKTKMARPEPREDILTADQHEAAMNAIANKPKLAPIRDMLVALRETGCRPKEVRTLTVDRVDLAAGTWQVLDKIRKKTGKEFRTVYLSPAAIELSRRLAAKQGGGFLFRNMLGRPWTKDAVNGAFANLREKMAYGPEFVPYAYRHLYVTDALERGVNPATVAELVGHTNLNMIMKVYSKLKLRTDHLKAAAGIVTGASLASRPAEASGDRPAES